MSIEVRDYGRTDAGGAVSLFTLSNSRGTTAEIIDFGAILAALRVPDRDGAVADVTLGYDSLAGWQRNEAYFGATVGRYGNRIAGARFELDGGIFQLPANDGRNCIHGGVAGFHKRMWTATADPAANAVALAYTSGDGEEGFPGELHARVVYTLTEANELRLDFGAETTAPTVVNLVHHSYWNLTGDATQDVGGHLVQVCADRFTAVDETLIPTGQLAPVAGTYMDLRQPRGLSALLSGHGGFDHNFVIADEPGELQTAAVVCEPSSGRCLEVVTDQAGVQLYTGNFLDGTIVGKGGVAYRQHTGLCLETQAWPDSPNQPSFPSVVLRPGETYRHTMIHRFGVTEQ